MKSQLRLVLIAALVILCPWQSSAQDKPSVAETVENLKFQLLDVKAREDNLRLRVQQLDEDLKPENIERALAGVGSTRPEELREQRRRQLTVEKAGVAAQLEEAASQRSRLEAALAAAEVEAYQQSARGSSAIQNEMLGSQSAITFRWLLLGALVVVVGIGVSLMVILRLRVSGRNDS